MLLIYHLIQSTCYTGAYMSKVLTVEEVADRLRIHAETVRAYLRKGELEGINQGGRAGWRISEDNLRRYLARKAGLPEPEPMPDEKCRVIAVSNQKGGVGKTTTVANVGYALAERGRKVLLVDMDPQANLSLGLGVAEAAEQKNIVSIFRQEDRLLSSLIVPTKTANLDIVPSHIDLANAEQLAAGRFSRDSILRDAISEELRGHYDYIILDSPPNFGLLADNCVVACSEVIVPVATHFYAVQGMSALLDRLRVVKKRMNPQLEVLGLLATRFDGRAVLCREVLAKMHTFNQMVFKTVISEAVKVAEAPAWSQTVIEFKPNSQSADQYRQLAAEIEGELVSSNLNLLEAVA